MATEGNVRVPPDSTGKRVDAASLDDGGVSVYRQKMVLAGASGSAEVVAVSLSAPAASAVGLVVRQAGTLTAVVTGTVNVNGGVALSGTGIVAGVVGLTAGTQNIGHINHISATVDVAFASGLAISGTPSVVLAAGTANFGTLNDISKTVQVAVATPFTINNISATSIVAGTLNLSGSVVIAGSVNIFNNAEVMSASRGPRTVIASTSANATLIAAPGANLAIYVTHVAVSNASGSNTRGRIGTSATIGAVQMMLAASGGGFVMQFTPPWQLSTNEALLCSVKPNASEGIFNVHYFVGSADAF
jgi:hypothetical protein